MYKGITERGGEMRVEGKENWRGRYEEREDNGEREKETGRDMIGGQERIREGKRHLNKGI